MDKVIVGTADWSKLFAMDDFFKYRYYLQMITSTCDHGLQVKWYISLRISSNIIAFSRRNL